MSGAAVRFEAVRATYRGSALAAVDGVSLEIPEGALVVLLGPSGCGKTTLLRTVNRMVEPQAGTVYIDGADVRAGDATHLRRGMGYVIQAVGLFAHMSVAQNVGIVPQLLGWSQPDITARVDELLTLVQLDPAIYRERRPRELSGGQQQRVGVARALAARPRVLLMDEPFGAVDAIVRQSLQDETLRIQRTLATTTIFVTHDVDEALRIADRIVVMNAGKVVQYDTPLRVLAAPATEYVAQLMESHDGVRRLGVLHAGEAARPGAPVANAPRLDARATLRDALSLLLGGADAIAVTREDDPVGTLDFAAIRAAFAQAAQ